MRVIGAFVFTSDGGTPLSVRMFRSGRLIDKLAVRF